MKSNSKELQPEIRN